MTTKRDREGKVAGANCCLSQHSPGCNRDEAWMCPHHDKLALSGHEQSFCIFAWSTRQNTGAFAQLVQQISQPMQSSMLLQLPLQLAWLRKSSVNHSYCSVEQFYNTVSPLIIWAYCLPYSLNSTLSFRAQLHLCLGDCERRRSECAWKGVCEGLGSGGHLLPASYPS